MARARATMYLVLCTSYKYDVHIVAYYCGASYIVHRTSYIVPCTSSLSCIVYKDIVQGRLRCTIVLDKTIYHLYHTSTRVDVSRARRVRALVCAYVHRARYDVPVKIQQFFHLQGPATYQLWDHTSSNSETTTKRRRNDDRDHDDPPSVAPPRRDAG